MDRRSPFRHRPRTRKSAVRAGAGRSSAARRSRVQARGPRSLSAGEGWGKPRATGAHSTLPALPETRAAGSRGRPYRNPPLVAGCEHTKGDEGTLAKELGKLAP